MKKVLNFLGNVLIVAVLVVAIVMTVAIITSTRGEKARIPNLFGYALLSVQSDSMESDKGMFVGDVIIDKLLTEDEANALHVGDVITFIRMDKEGNEFLETHRIVEHKADLEVPAPEEEIIVGIWTRNGDKYYTTRGDNTPDVDLDAATQRVEYVYKTSIVGMWTGIRIPKLGTIMDFLQTSMGFMVCIVIPVALFFIYQLYVFIMTLTRRQKEKALEEVSSKEEELKQKAIAEFLAQQQTSGAEASSPDTKPADEDKPKDAQPEPEEKGKKKGKNKKANNEAAKSEAKAEEDKSEGEGKSEETAEDESKEEKKSEKDGSEGEDKSEEKAETEEADSSDEKSDAADETDADPDHTPEISEEEKNRIIQEYLAKQAKENKKD